MTSWNRGREDEAKGERNLNDPDLDDKIKGAGQKIGGEIEQGLDNIGDTITGKQQDLQGKQRNIEAEAKDRAEDLDRDLDNMGRNINRDIDNTTDRAGDWVQERGEDIRSGVDRAGDWVEERGEDVNRNLDA